MEELGLRLRLLPPPPPPVISNIRYVGIFFSPPNQAEYLILMYMFVKWMNNSRNESAEISGDGERGVASEPQVLACQTSGVAVAAAEQ